MRSGGEQTPSQPKPDPEPPEPGKIKSERETIFDNYYYRSGSYIYAGSATFELSDGNYTHHTHHQSAHILQTSGNKINKPAGSAAGCSQP